MTRAPILLALLAAGCTGPVPATRPGAQNAAADTAATGGGLRGVLPTAATARFLDARAVGSDASGRLYVADAGAAHVVVFAPDGRAEAVLGGPGTADESLAEPADVDPTNGQAVYVADAGTGRVVRFTAERRAAEAIPVPDAADLRDALAGRRDEARGRPVAVAAGAGNALYVAEARRGVVLVFDAARRVERIVGGPDAGPAALRAPTSLAVDARGRLFVVDGGDAGPGTVRTFDAFGLPGAPLAVEGVGTVRSVSVAGPLVLVAGDAGVVVFRGTAALATLASPVPLVDAAVAGGAVWGLGRTRLVRLGAAPD